MICDMIGLDVNDVWRISGIRLKLKNSHEKDCKIIIVSNLIWYFKTGFLEKLGFKIQMKTDHKVAVGCLLDGVDVFAVLQTGFGQSLVFQAFVMTSKMASNYHATAIVYTLLKSITEELQIWEVNGLGILAASLTKLSVVEFKSADFQLLYGSAESV